MVKRKRIIEQLEKENLLEILLEKIYYKNIIVNKIVEGNSPFNPSFKKIDLVYRENYFIENEELYSEVKNYKYDEWDFVLLPDKSPVLTNEIIKPTEYQIKQLLLKLPEDKLVNIILKAKSIQEYRRYQKSEEIINYLEKYDLTHILQKEIYYIISYGRKRKIEKSKKVEEWWNLNIVELTCRTIYFLKHYDKNECPIFFDEESNITYDEGDYKFKPGHHPLTEKAQEITKEELFSLIIRLPYERLQYISKKIEEIVYFINLKRENDDSLEQIPKLILK